MTQLDLASPTPSRTRSACPTLREPMQTGDGLLARLRPVAGTVSPAQLTDIATLAAQHGNGQIEITARGNLQVRGLRAETVPAFAAAIERIVAIHTGLPIETPPLAGLDPHEIADPRPLAEAIRRAVDLSPLNAAFGPKVTLVIDGSGSIRLDALTADIRLRAVHSAGKILWALDIGTTAIGLLHPDTVADAAMITLAAIAELGPQGRGRALDLATLRPQLAPFITAEAPPPPPAPPAQNRITLTDTRVVARIGLPFGAASTAQLRDVSEAAQAAGITEFRLAPHHGLIALCSSPTIAEKFQHAAATMGFITTPTDPRRAISACIGSDGCASGTIPARRMAETLAKAEPAFFDGSFTLHVSGCAKGCAHPAPALLTLVGTDTDVALVLNGRASSTPALTLPADTLPIALRRLAALWRDEGVLGESVASCFKRLGETAIATALRQGWK